MLDDYRSVHTPGVACAVWEAVVLGDLRPICLTESKFYATWGSPETYQEPLWEWIRDNPRAWGEYQHVSGHDLIRMNVKDAAGQPRPLSVSSKPARPVSPDAARPSKTKGKGWQPTSPDRPDHPRGRLRRLAVDLSPPMVTRQLHRWRSHHAVARR